MMGRNGRSIWQPPGKKLIILQTPLRRELPEAVAEWPVVLEHGGFSLISSKLL